MPDETIASRLERLNKRIADACRRSGRSSEEITLIAITKGVGAASIHEAIEAGVHHVGENRTQEAEAKRPDVEDAREPVTWHMVGHLQTNKVGAALRLFDIIHSVDSLPLAEAISRRASSRQPIFLEVNVSEEPSKYGFSLDKLPERFEAIATLPGIKVQGLMTVAPQTDNTARLRPIFRRLKKAASSLGLAQLSMGMSDDFEVAIEEGATQIRIGRALFGERLQ
jgi:pyridoxal phosphate enzyme (YggS family)